MKAVKLSVGLILENPEGKANHGDPCCYLLMSRDKEGDTYYWSVATIYRHETPFPDDGCQLTGMGYEKRTDEELLGLEVIGDITPLVAITYPKFISLHGE